MAERQSRQYVFVALDARAVELASSVYKASCFAELVTDPIWNWDSVKAWTILPSDLAGAKLPDPGWGLWDELPRKPSQREIDMCGKLADRWVVSRASAAESGIVLFDDPIRRGQAVTASDGRIVSPHDDRHYWIVRDEVTEASVFALLEHCCQEWAGGALIGRAAKSGAVRPDPVPGLVVAVDAFAFFAFDGEATVIVTGAAEKLTAE